MTRRISKSFFSPSRTDGKRGGFRVGPWVMVVITLFSTGAASPSDIDTLVHHLDIVAFGNEYTGEKFPRVRKWKNPIRIGVQGIAPAYLDEDIRQHTGQLGRLSGHPIDLVYSENMRKSGQVASDFKTSQVNVIVFFTARDQIHQKILQYFDNKKEWVDQMMQSSTCFAKFFKKKDEIKAAIVVIPSHHSREIVRACVVEELTQIMGLPNDSDLVTESIFNDKSRFNELTPQDQILLRTLYDGRIQIGMPRDAALALARTILEGNP
ncbi:MAG: DUF2927 protein [Magnetococcales bacterium]|nr:DUF2927 protein [Magnetococcales bacterium]HIJ83763.1 DUF2927 domain-containing protein [Magnetococcales bacterium]